MSGDAGAAWPFPGHRLPLNHGSFGAVPAAVQAARRAWLDAVEADPETFFRERLAPLLADVRARLGAFLGAPGDDLALLPNATHGLNTVLASLPPGGEIVITNRIYAGARRAVEHWAAARGHTLRRAELPVPLPQETAPVRDALAAVLTPRTRLVVLEDVASPTGEALPVDALVAWLRREGVAVLIDGAHGPGNRRVDLQRLQPDFYTGNGHKWLCAPHGAGFLYVAPAHQARVRPRVTGVEPGGSGFATAFEWPGTFDPSPWLTLPEAIECLEGALAGGWPAIRERNHAMAAAGQQALAHLARPDAALPAGTSMTALPLAPERAGDDLMARLRRQAGVEVAVLAWPGPRDRLLRISAHLYNDADDYRLLARHLEAALA